MRVRTPRQRQEVTGVIVNRRINVPREFIREIRAILSDCKRRGWENAAQRFAMKTRIMPGKTLTPDRFKHIVRGKIEYIGAVRGRTDMIYLRYLAEFARLAPEFASEKTLSWLREQDKYQSVLDKLVIVEVDYPSGLIPNGGTAFFLKDVGLVTCAHLFKEKRCEIEVFRRTEPDKKSRANINVTDEGKDIAVLYNSLATAHYFEPSTRDVKIGDTVYLTGFPKYSEWNVGIVSQGEVTAIRHDYVHKNPRIQINADIIYGNSGGPVFDKNWKVIGIAARGAESQDAASETEFHGVIPISEVYKLLGSTETEES